jgi:arylsulfatase A-like enzyme
MVTNPPNILWIMADQFRADCLGCLGHPAAQTPNLDRLAAEGILFENAFCQSPVCMASRGSLFTGRYPSTIRVRGMGILPPSETTTPEWLQRHGYFTGSFGKLHLTPQLYTRQVLGAKRPILDWRQFAKDAGLPPLPDHPCKLNYGFQDHVDVEDSLPGVFQDWLKQTRPDLAEKPSERIPGGPGDLFVSPYPSDCHPTTFIAREAEAFIRHRRPPWFAFCSFIAPHHPFEAPADQIARFDEAAIPLPDFKGGVDPRFIPEPARKAVDEVLAWADPVKRRVALHYLAAIRLIDEGVGRLLGALEETGQLANTIVLFNADHGEFLGNHGLIRKPSLHYDEVLRVPLLMRLPGGEAAGRRVPGLVELTDVHPTLLRLAGLGINPGVQGRDWSEALLHNGPIGRESILSDMYDDCVRPETCLIAPGGGPYMAVQTLRTEGWKLNVYPTAGPEYGQLFDLTNDPDESRNLYGDPAYRDVREGMLWRLMQRIAANADPLPRVLSQW